MNLSEAVKIFEPFHKWCLAMVDPNSDLKDFEEYDELQVLEAQSVILNEAKQNLAFEMSVKDPASETKTN